MTEAEKAAHELAEAQSFCARTLRSAFQSWEVSQAIAEQDVDLYHQALDALRSWREATESLLTLVAEGQGL